MLQLPRSGSAPPAIARRIPRAAGVISSGTNAMRPAQPPAQSDSPQFTRVAEIYDELMAGISYDLWFCYIRDIWRARGLSPKSVLDVACGTGNMTYRFAAAGLEAWGVDCSQAMVDTARSKLPDYRGAGPAPEFLCQNAAAMTLPQTFDAAVSLFDSLNYILQEDDLRSAFQSVWTHLSPGGLFVFDMNTVYALSHRFFDQDNLSSQRFPLYRWVSSWDPDTRLCTIEMDFRVLGDSGVEEFHETHYQRGYSTLQIKDGLECASFTEIEFCQAFTSRPPSGRTDRIYVIARRPS